MRNCIIRAASCTVFVTLHQDKTVNITEDLAPWHIWTVLPTASAASSIKAAGQPVKNTESFLSANISNQNLSGLVGFVFRHRDRNFTKINNRAEYLTCHLFVFCRQIIHGDSMERQRTSSACFRAPNLASRRKRRIVPSDSCGGAPLWVCAHVLPLPFPSARSPTKDLSLLPGQSFRLPLPLPFERPPRLLIQPSIDLPSKVDPVNVWDEMRNKLKEVVALRYRQKHGQPAVLVIDGADIIVKQNQPFFSVLQDFAKASADSGDLRVVFVSIDGTAVDFLQSRSAISRAEAPLVIPGVPDDQVVKYLVDKGLKNNQAKSAVQEVTGGSFVKMNDYVREVNKGRTHEEIVLKEQRWIVDELEDMGLDAEPNLFQELVKQGSLPANRVRNLLVEGKVPAEKVNLMMFFSSKRSRLLEKNIISQLDSEFKFNNRAVYFFFQSQKEKSLVTHFLCFAKKLWVF